jgi:hypothetical protein
MRVKGLPRTFSKVSGDFISIPIPNTSNLPIGTKFCFPPFLSLLRLPTVCTSFRMIILNRDFLSHSANMNNLLLQHGGFNDDSDDDDDDIDLKQLVDSDSDDPFSS